MKIAIRGEGSTDIGVLKPDGSLEKGPMLILTEKLECYQNLCSELGSTDEYSVIMWHYIHKDKIKEATNARAGFAMRGKKGDMKRKGFYDNSKSFAQLAKEEEADLVLFFVDADKDSPSDRRKEVKLGLSECGFNEKGVPMIPNKISEAWLMCCLSGYKNCADHENVTTNKTSPKYPKKVCHASGKTRHAIAENCDPNKIDMPSFNQFREDFSRAINSFMGYEVC